MTCFFSRRSLLGPDSGASVRNCSGAFSLIELLVVIAIILVLMGLVVLPMTNMSSAGNLTKTTADIAGILEGARTYAMANNTYVWVGFAETDASRLASANPQTPGTGRIAVAVVASKDGTRGYDATSTGLGTPPWPDNKGTTLVAISPLKHFENVHLAPSLPNQGGLSRPTISPGNYSLGNTNSITSFDWPLGNATGAGQYSFTKVINFDPQGVPRIQTSVNADTVVTYMEIDLIPTHGNNVPTTSSNVAAIQVNGMTGATRIYRP